jgi:hypothetical protein
MDQNSSDAIFVLILVLIHQMDLVAEDVSFVIVKKILFFQVVGPGSGAMNFLQNVIYPNYLELKNLKIPLFIYFSV